MQKGADDGLSRQRLTGRLSSGSPVRTQRIGKGG